MRSTRAAPQAAPFAGGTWIMRAPIRHEPLKSHYVAIGKIPQLHAIKVDADVVEIGAAVTHAALAAALAELSEFDVLTAAAGRSANPAIRTMATIGGNLATTAFAAADCVPALLCLDAEVEIASRGGRERIDLGAISDSEIDTCTRVVGPPHHRASARSQNHSRPPAAATGRRLSRLPSSVSP